MRKKTNEVTVDLENRTKVIEDCNMINQDCDITESVGTGTKKDNKPGNEIKKSSITIPEVHKLAGNNQVPSSNGTSNISQSEQYEEKNVTIEKLVKIFT